MKHVSSFAFYSSLVLGLIVIAAGLPLIDSIVHGLGATPDAFGFTKDYVLMMLIGSPFVILFFTLENIVRSEGAAITSMVGMILSVVVNIVLDALVIFVFHWGSSAWRRLRLFPTWSRVLSTPSIWGLGANS